MKTKVILTTMLLSATILFNGCAKKGDTGPAGKDGANGNANVISTNNVTLTASSWSNVSNQWVGTLTASGITQAVVDNGMVQVYIKYATEWVPLPDISGINSTVFSFYLGGIDLINSNSDGSLPTNPGTQTFRVVIIPASAIIKHPNVDYKNYTQVKNTFNLPN